MAVSLTSTFELTRDALIRRGMQLAGALEASNTPDPDDIAMAADFLGMELLALQAEGIVLGTMERPVVPLNLVANTREYILAADTLDVFVGPENLAGTYSTTLFGTESPVRAISRHEYMTGISAKATTGVPSLVYIERQALVTLVFWPVPAVAGVFHYERQRLPRDMDTGARTLDLGRKWQKAIVYAIAWQLAMAKSIPMERVQYLRQVAEAEKATARYQDVEKGHSQFYIPRYS